MPRTKAPTIIKENLKLKNTWQVNLSPLKTCKGRKCLSICYAMKAFVQWPPARTSWNRNYRSYQRAPQAYFDSIITRIHRAKKTVQWFRWHSAGDIPDQRYLEGMKRVAISCPDTKFLVYTKKYSLTFGRVPSNLRIIASSWPGLEIPRRVKRRFPIAWFQDGRDNRIPKGTFVCPGNEIGCDNCRFCWYTEKSLIFHKH